MFVKLKLRQGASGDGFPIPPARYPPFRLARERQGAIIGLDRFGAIFAFQAPDIRWSRLRANLRGRDWCDERDSETDGDLHRQ